MCVYTVMFLRGRVAAFEQTRTFLHNFAQFRASFAGNSGRKKRAERYKQAETNCLTRLPQRHMVAGMVVLTRPAIMFRHSATDALPYPLEFLPAPESLPCSLSCWQLHRGELHFQGQCPLQTKPFLGNPLR